MEITEYSRMPVLLLGSGRLSFSVCACLLNAGHQVTVVTEDKEASLNGINEHLSDLARIKNVEFLDDGLIITEQADQKLYFNLVIIVCEESLEVKRNLIQSVVKGLPRNSIIAVNTESISLADLQRETIGAERVIGLNWAEPAHTTNFLELIANDVNSVPYTDALTRIAKESWKKSPYLVTGEFGIRARILCAMAREAFFLVEQGYATIEGIDRCCRNDGGYYLPFAGNFRYMDLMGVGSYGMVMKDLNPDLSRSSHVPDFFTDVLNVGGKGLENNQGLYEYEEGDAERLRELFREFSFQIQQIIDKYPFKIKTRG